MACSLTFNQDGLHDTAAEPKDKKYRALYNSLFPFPFISMASGVQKAVICHSCCTVHCLLWSWC